MQLGGSRKAAMLSTLRDRERIDPATIGTALEGCSRTVGHVRTKPSETCNDGAIDGEVIPTTCSNIGYSQVWGRVDGGDTTNSILRGIRRSAPFVVIALLIMIAALSFSTLGNTKEDVKTLVGAVLYIFAALCLGLGMIFYISAVNDEVSRLKDPDSDDEPVFEYGYGWAVMCAGGSFISSMVAAVTDISIYLKRYPNIEDMVLIIPGLQKKSRLTLSLDDEDVDEDEDEEDLYVEERCGSPYAIGRRNNTVIL
ncbi:Voltage-dependent calcium channel gamma-5 subunit [Lamellibrachia satsuma]|nr:Voltage-dependent calcium channel gamma-5 subunit [Lamellibrachia satsuma]